MALSTRLMITWTMSRASMFTSKSSSKYWRRMVCSRLLRLTCRRASSMTSSISWDDSCRFIRPSSMRVMDNRFSTRPMSYWASSKMSMQIFCRVSGSRASPLESRLLALPEMEVRGGRRSWEMVRSRLARSCSFCACTVACSFSRAFRRFSMARPHSPRMDSSTLLSKASSGFSERSMPTTPKTPLPVRMAMCSSASRSARLTTNPPCSRF